MIEGISHLTFVVQDLERMATFLTTVFEAEEVYDSDQQSFSVAREKFFLIDDLWLAIMEGNSLSERTYNHVAFKIPDDAFEIYVQRVKELGVEIKLSRSRIEGEGRSLYFYDYDNHLFELHTGTIEQRLQAYRKAMG
ncbi:MAG: FosX/FosE/FosI family fosfomycin resistance hydrolase [Elainellaceae cyanobacterium]